MARCLTSFKLLLALGLVAGSASLRADEPEDYDTYGQVHARPSVVDAQPLEEEPQGEAFQEIEIIRERHPNRSVKIEREVAQDSSGNYVNHGSWTEWDPNGNLLAKGQYHEGQRHGEWSRWHRRADARLFGEAPFDQFEEPFVSQATFERGTLNGTWTIFDAKQRKVSEIEINGGRRDGIAALYFPDGKKMREANFRNGLLEGKYRQWAPGSKLMIDDTYQAGRKVASKVSYHSAEQKSSEGGYLEAALVVERPDDWASAQLASYVTKGKDEKHGLWTSWYPNGQTRVQGEYRNDLAVGRFTWWHSNGQKASEGEYENGLQHGHWTWWHPNGQKKAEGAYAHGEQTGRWLLWKEDGRLAEASEHSLSTPVGIAQAKEKNEPTPAEPETLQR